MSEQGDFFDQLIDSKTYPPLAVTLTVRGGEIEAQWNRVRSYPVRFPSWPAALASVCHPLNDHIRVKVRA